MASKITEILIGVILVGICIAGINIYLSGMEEYYDPLENRTVNFSSSTAYLYESTAVKEFVIGNQTDNKSVKTRTEEMSANTGAIGAVYDFFIGAASVFMIIVRTPGHVVHMIGDLMLYLPAGADDDFKKLLINGLSAIVYIIIFIGIIWAVLLRSGDGL